MNWANKLYTQSPVWLQNTALSAYGYFWHRRRFGGIFEEALTGFKSRENFNTQQFSAYQTLQLRRLLVHAFESVPYYQKIFKINGLNVSSLQKTALQDLHKIPFLEKNTLRQQGRTDLLSRKREPGGQFFSSSGSTGTPTQILFSNAMHQKWSAGFEARIRHWAGVTRHDPRGMIGGRRVVPDGHGKPPFYRYNSVEKQTYLSAYHISAANAPDFLEGMKRHCVTYMNGYAMSNYFLARFLEESGLEAPQLKAVLSSSEALSPEMRDTFKRVYGCKTFDAWSGVEACGLISECEHGQLHTSPDIAILEFIDPETGRPAAPGQLAEVICTGLLNFDQPLIRYRIGDLMRFSDKPCPCGRQMAVIQEISGRIEDTVVGPDGREMVRFHGIFVDMPDILEGQIIQHDHTRFEIKTVSVKPLSESDRRVIRQRMISQLGEIRVEINEVSQIPRGPNGKFKAVVSGIKRTII
ncbi:MAG: phenylacetate--CoA ligase family protein [Saprospiraceae bacterium]